MIDLRNERAVRRLPKRPEAHSCVKAVYLSRGGHRGVRTNNGSLTNGGDRASFT